MGGLELHRCAGVRHLLDPAQEQRPHCRHYNGRRGCVCLPRRVRVRARRSFPGREVLFTLFTLGLLFPIGRRDPAAVRPRPDRWGSSITHSGSRFPQAAFACRSRSSFCGRSFEASRPNSRTPPDRRLRDVRLFLAHPATALSPGACDGRRPHDRGELEPVPAAARDPVRPGELDAAAGRVELLYAVLVRHRRGFLPTRRSRSFPPLVFYLFAERQIVGGLTSGAVKG